MKKYDIVTALDTCVDLIMTGNIVPEFHQREKIVGDYAVEMGGSNCIFACQAAKLGLKTAGVGVLGKDAFGDTVLARLESSGVDTSHILIDDKQKTGLGIALCKENDRAILTYLGTINASGLETRLDALLADTKLLHIGSYYLMDEIRPHYLSLVKKAKQLGAKISLDTNWDPSEAWQNGLWELLPLVDVFLPNENEALAITKCETIEAAGKKLCDYAEIVAIKQGENGGSVFTKSGQMLTQKSYSVNYVDSIGAGDSFDGGFLYGYLNDLPLADCLKYGLVCGSMNVEASGGTTGQPRLTELAAFLKTRG